MSLKKLLVFLSLVSCITTVYTAPVHAMTVAAEIDSCRVFSEADKNDGKSDGKDVEEEEPDCE